MPSHHPRPSLFARSIPHFTFLCINISLCLPPAQRAQTPASRNLGKSNSKSQDLRAANQMLSRNKRSTRRNFQLRASRNAMVRICTITRSPPAQKYYGAYFCGNKKPASSKVLWCEFCDQTQAGCFPGLRVSRPHVANWLKDMSCLQKPLENRGTDSETAHYDYHPKVSFFCKIINFLNPL